MERKERCAALKACAGPIPACQITRLGWEQAGRRPALVVSPAPFARNTGFLVVCPITSRIRPFPTSVVLPDGLPFKGEILVSHIRSIDALARPVRAIGVAISEKTAAEVRAKIGLLITI